MQRIFDAVTRPLLEAAEPSVVVRLPGLDVGDPVAGWCSQRGARLHTIGADSLADGTTADALVGTDPVAVVVTDAQCDPDAVIRALARIFGSSATPRARRLLVLGGLGAFGESQPGDHGDAQEVAAGLLAPLDPSLRAWVLPNDVLVVMDPLVAEAIGDVWQEIVMSVVGVGASTAPASASSTGPSPTWPSGESDVAVLRRIIDRQDRQLAELRRAGRREDALERQVERLEYELDRLVSRRSVSAVLRIAAYARPLFRLARGETSWRDLLGRAWPQRHRPSRHRRLRTRHEFASTDTGRFYDTVRPIVETGEPEFVDAWAGSEEELRASTSALPREDQPLVSIVMPTYNRAHLIREAIDSVTDQTYLHWELLVCDDGSDDDTARVVAAVSDDRVIYQKLPRGGAAAARNAGLARAQGSLFAYLDTDNLWHPRFLEQMVSALVANPGRHAVYAKYLDVVVTGETQEVKRFRPLPFDYERLMEKNFVDLNSLVHRRALYDRYGGFNEQLVRQQDWDLILKYSFLRDPLYIDRFLALYRRNAAWGQITDVHASNRSTEPTIAAAVASYHRYGLPRRPDVSSSMRLTVLSWDICRNHFSKAYNLAEAVAEDDPDRVQLVGFRFFDEPIFPPYATAAPAFETSYLDGASFPAFDDAFARAAASVRGDVVYAVKPRLPSLGVALLANYHFGYPVVLEMNDLESVVTTPEVGQRAAAVDLADVDPSDPRLRDPYGALWTQIMEGLSPRVPLRATHNHVLDHHFGGGAFYVRNPKDDAHFDPDRFDRDRVRADLGLGPEDRVLLFGGMVRRHKGVFRFAEVLERLGPHWHLLVVGSRETPDQRRLRERVGDRLRIIEPVDRNEMARVNVAADAVVLWLDPDVPASHYQMPFKLTDALAMRVPVLANPIGELEDLGERGYLRLVPYGDDDALTAALEGLSADPQSTQRMVEAGRRLYLRQFSYRAVRETMDLILDAAAPGSGPLPVAEEFARFFAAFRAAQPDGRRVFGGAS